MIYFICIIHLHIFHGNIWTHNWPAPNVSGFIAQLVERRSGIREVTGSSPVEVLNFFQASLRNCKNCDHNCEDHSSFDFISAVHIWFISYASFIYEYYKSYLGNPPPPPPPQSEETVLRVLDNLSSPWSSLFLFFESAAGSNFSAMTLKSVIMEPWRGVAVGRQVSGFCYYFKHACN